VKPNKSTEYFYALDALRGVAAFAVAISHFTTGTQYALFRYGSIAVDFFFILSGFVVTHSYRERLRRGMPTYEYILRRLVRLYPMFIIGLLFGLVVFFYSHSFYGYSSSRRHDVLESVGWNAFFLPYLGHRGSVFPANSPLWSLSLEMLASLVFLLLARLPLKTLLQVVAFSYVLMVILSIEQCLDGNCSHRLEILTNGGWHTSNIWIGPPRVLYGFALGMVIYECRERLRSARLAARFSRIRHRQTVLCVSLLLVLAFPGSVRGVYYFAIISSIAPLIVCLGAMTTPANDRSRDWARVLGRLSYPVYCLHYPIVLGFAALNDRFAFSGRSHVLPLFGGLAITLILSFTLTKFYDEPVREYLLGKLRAYFRASENQATGVR
jgi:peptidoglycan/LPS O-acetylase OafA/YrhL